MKAWVRRRALNLTEPYNALWGYFRVSEKEQKGQRNSWTCALITRIIHEWAETHTKDAKLKSGFISPSCWPTLGCQPHPTLAGSSARAEDQWTFNWRWKSGNSYESIRAWAEKSVVGRARYWSKTDRSVGCFRSCNERLKGGGIYFLHGSKGPTHSPQGRYARVEHFLLAEKKGTEWGVGARKASQGTLPMTPPPLTMALPPAFHSFPIKPPYDYLMR